MGLEEGQDQSDLASKLILDDEDIAFLSSLKRDGPEQPSASDSTPQPEDEERDLGPRSVCIAQFRIRPLSWNDTLTGVPARIRNVCHGAGISTFGELLLADLTSLSGLGHDSRESIDRFVVMCAASAPSIYLPHSDETQLICHQTRDRDVIWGPFGQLHPLSGSSGKADLDASFLIGEGVPTEPAEPLPDDAREESTDLEVPIDLLDLPRPRIRRLLMNGYHTISDLDQASDERLLSIRGFGTESLERVRSAIKRYRRLSGIPNRKRPDRSQEATPPISWDSGTPLEEAGLPVTLSRLLMRNGYRTIGDLASASEDQLSAIRGLGAQKLEMVRQALNQHIEATADRCTFSDEASRLSDEAKRLLELSDLLIPEQPFRAWALPVAQTLIGRGEGSATSLVAQLITI